MTSRAWFTTLPTGEERTAVSSITDPAFLQLFLDLCSRSDDEANVPLSLEEITSLYEMYSSHPSKDDKSSSYTKATIIDSNPLMNTPVKNTSTESSNMSPSAYASPLSPLSIVTEAPTPTSVDDEKIAKLLNMLLSHVYTLLPTAFAAEAGLMEKFLKGSHGKKKKQKEQGHDAVLPRCDGPLVAVSLDPAILGTGGGSSLFVNLADKIVGQEDAGKLRYLMDQSKDKLWPHWLLSHCEHKISLGLILLAGFEMSIYKSHQRSLNKKPQHVMLHLGLDSALHTLLQLNPTASDTQATKLLDEIERAFRLRKMLMENDGDRVLSLVSHEEWSNLDTNVKMNFEGTIKAEHLLMAPFQWIISSSSAGEFLGDWNSLIAEMWSKIRDNLSDEGQKKSQKYEEDVLIEDIENIGELEAPFSAKKKKKKQKKKSKKKPTNNDIADHKDDQQETSHVNAPLKGAEASAATIANNEVKETVAKVAMGSEDPSSKSTKSVEDKDNKDASSSSPSVATRPVKAESTLSDSSAKTAEENDDKEEENKANDDAEDSAWETVAAKPRKPKPKQSDDQPNNNRSNPGRSGRNNGTGASNNGEGGNNSGGRRKRDRRRDKKKGNSSKNVAKDVITHILDAVDDEVSQKGKQGTKSAPSDDKQKFSHNDRRSSTTANNKNSYDQKRKATNTAALSSTTNPNQQTRSLRDVVAGVTVAPSTDKAKPPSEAQNSIKPVVPEPARDSKIKPGLSYKSVIEPSRQQSMAVTSIMPNEENKAPEKSEKVTKEVAEAQSSVAKPENAATIIANLDKGTPPAPDIVTEGKEHASKEEPSQLPPSPTDDDRNTPPLSTLLGPGTSCSATSSVASSLEAPHSSRFRHQSISTTEDVGVHLLNVCKQLSEEIDTFMLRRSLALDVRRKERSAVLGALQDTLLKIWPGNCHVEMYGSCATQLDLPSSDLDLVVCGLDEMMMNHIPIDPTSGSIIMTPNSSVHNLQNHSPSAQGLQRQQSFDPLATNENMQRQQSFDPSNSAQNMQHQQSFDPSTITQNLHHQMSFENGSQNLHQSFDNSIHSTPSSPDEITVDQNTPRKDINTSLAESNPDEIAEFVPGSDPGIVYDGSEGDVTMGMESYNPEFNGSEQEFYYVPYNYVPPMALNAQRVIRLASELEMQPWAVQVKAIPTAAVPVVKILADPSKLPGASGAGDNWMMQQHIAAQAGAPGTPPLSPDQIPSSHFFSQPSMPSWRGADIMNGLQPVDITFEGPEHGGIGSTTYSSCVVQDACNETGLSPEKTPVVQVKMVLKELLAQRRLNEPFTGGLSSYALLLLLLAVVKERQLIQEEMERVEQQRQEVNQPDTRVGKPGQKQSSTDPRLSAAQRVAGRDTSSKPPKSNKHEKSATADSSSNAKAAANKKTNAPNIISKHVSSSSWASIAKKSNGSTTRTDTSTATISNSSSLIAKKHANEKSKTLQPSTTEKTNASSNEVPSAPSHTLEQSGSTMNTTETESEQGPSKIINSLPQSKVNTDGEVPPSSEDGVKPPVIPQCSNDVLEVLCSGELTAGKLLMHFLLFYGQHFDAQSTLIDVNGTHHPEYEILDIAKLSPFVPRPPGGNIDPITGMYSVDPIVVYDPLEGAMDHNVAKRCYCWNNVRWVFAQSYMTVSSIVEGSGTSSKTGNKERHRRDKKKDVSDGANISVDPSSQKEETNGDVASPILELLLSF